MATPSATLTGLETEFACAGRTSTGQPLPAHEVLNAFHLEAAKCLTSIPDAEGEGIFLENGARLYRDPGNGGAHAEFATPETADPWETVRYIRAGERIVCRVAGRLSSRSRICDARFFKNNVDYSGSGASWGTHESYLYRNTSEDWPDQLIPFLISRIIFTGAGGFNSRSQGIEFTLSPRVFHLERAVSGDSTGNRGIFHTKDETHAAIGGDCHRLHLICGESLCSDTGMWLRTATTALVVAMIDAGLNPGKCVQPKEPLRAMRSIASDPFLKKRVPMRGGDHMTAIEIQRHYLAMAEKHLGDAFFPPWAAEACRQWKQILDLLSSGAPDSVSTILDWAIKLSVFDRRIRKHELHWETLREWSKAIDAFPIDLPLRLTARMASDPPAEIVGALELLKAKRAGGHGLDAHRLPEFLRLRDELWELDTRFMQLGSEGLFDQLDRAGVLDHGFEGVENITHAIENPPGQSRAKVRGTVVKRLAACASNDQYRCTWTRIDDLKEERFLDTHNPFTSEEKWGPLEMDDPFSFAHLQRLHSRSRARMNPSLGDVLRRFDRGEYRSASQLLDRVEERMRSGEESESEGEDSVTCRRYRAWIHARLGNADHAHRALRKLRNSRTVDAFSLVGDHVCSLRYLGLAGDPQIDAWIEKGLQLIENREISSATVPFLGHVGFRFNRLGRYDEAEAQLEAARAAFLSLCPHPHVRATLYAELGENCRRRHDFDGALGWFAKAEEIHRARRFSGDLADLTFIGRGQVEAEAGRTSRAVELLEKALEIQRRLHNPGEAKSRLLLCRISASASASALESHRERIILLAAERPGLARCPILATILEHWPNWISGDPSPTGPEKSRNDRFWGI